MPERFALITHRTVSLLHELTEPARGKGEEGAETD